MGMFQGKTAVITGGTSGIGRDIALALGRAGANVVVAARNAGTKLGDYGEDSGRSVSDILGDEGRGASFFATDVTDAAQVDALADHAVAVFGTLDIWINNAGVVAAPKPFWEYENSEFEHCLAVNTAGVWNGMRAATRHMLRQDVKGNIVNILSTAALRPHAGQSIYDISKAAAAQATKCAALELGPSGIRVNAVCPTVVKTAITRHFVETPEFQDWFKSEVPLGLAVDAKQVTDATLFLASDAASSITGILMPIDAGETLGRPGQQGLPQSKTN